MSLFLQFLSNIQSRVIVYVLVPTNILHHFWAPLDFSLSKGDKVYCLTMENFKVTMTFNSDSLNRSIRICIINYGKESAITWLLIFTILGENSHHYEKFARMLAGKRSTASCINCFSPWDSGSWPGTAARIWIQPHPYMVVLMLFSEHYGLIGPHPRG